MAATIIDREEKALERVVVGGSTTEALAGAGTAILAILGLTGVTPTDMAAIAAIALGGAFMLDSGLLAAEYSKMTSRSANTPLAAAELGGGLSAQLAAGIAALVLGILALIGEDPVTLLAATTVALGAGMILGSGVMSRINAVQVQAPVDSEPAARLAHGAVSVATGAQILTSVAATVLGILALTGFAPTMLVLVSMLGMGITSLLSGSAVAGRMLSIFPA